MRRPLIAVAAVVLAFSALAAADEWKKTYQVTGTPELRVDAGDGNVRIISWGRSEVQAQVFTEGWRIGPDDVRITERQMGNRVEIEIRLPRTHFNFGHRSLRVELAVPRQANLDVHTSDGNITADALKGDSRFASGDGNLDIRGYDGALRASTGDGNIQLLGRFDTLDVHTGDGRIDAEAQRGSRMTGEWSLRSGDGSIILRLPDGFAADLDAHTADGRISVDLPITVSGSISQTRLRGKLNGGGQILELRSGDGNISLRRS
jgi:hypothetical protein